MVYSAASWACSDALGTGVRRELVPRNQWNTNLKLLQVVDLNSYRVSTSAPAIATGARGELAFQMAQNKAKRAIGLVAMWK
jgi:hypothetical protein